MDFRKLFFGGIIGGIVNFLLGWLVYGILLMEIMRKHSTHRPSVFRTEEEMIWWSLILGNIAIGFMIAYVILKANIKTAGAGAVTGFVLGMLTSLGIDCIMYAQMKVFGRAVIAMDVVAAAIITAIVGAILGWYFGRGEKAT